MDLSKTECVCYYLMHFFGGKKALCSVVNVAFNLIHATIMKTKSCPVINLRENTFVSDIELLGVWYFLRFFKAIQKVKYPKPHWSTSQC